MFTKNIYATCAKTYKNLKCIINDPNIAFVSGDKESCVVIINRSDYFKKLQHTTDEGIQDGVYIVTEDRTLKDLKPFRGFLYRTLRNMNTTKRYYQRQINQDNCMELLKHTRSTTLQI